MRCRLSGVFSSSWIGKRGVRISTQLKRLRGGVEIGYKDTKLSFTSERRLNFGGRRLGVSYHKRKSTTGSGICHGFSRKLLTARVVMTFTARA